MSFKNVFCDLKSIYAIQASGELLWYQDLLRDGSNGSHGEQGWDIRSGSKISQGDETPGVDCDPAATIRTAGAVSARFRCW